MFPSIVVMGHTVPYYGLMGVVGFLLAMLYVIFRSPELGLGRENSIYILTFGGLGAMAGAKILYLLLELPGIICSWEWNLTYLTDTLRYYVSGGFIFYGGMAGAALGAWIFAGFLGLEFKEYLPALLPGFCIFHCFGRLGCFLAGCCYGKESNAGLGIIYHYSEYAPNEIRLIPVQLMEASAVFVIFLILHCYGSNNPKAGWKLAGIYLVLYAPLRFCLEFFRGDTYRGFLAGLSTSQWISIPVFALGIIILLEIFPVHDE